MKTLEVSNLSKQFTLHLMGGKIISACRDISFDLEKGEILAVVGPSGAGKSTLVRCIYQNYTPTSGSVTYRHDGDGGIDLCKADGEKILELRHTHIGYVSQHFTVIPRVPVLDVAAEPLLHNGVERGAAYEKAREYLKKVCIPEQLYDVYPAILSGGQKQRINIIRAVIQEPDLLLVDEPTSFLDKSSVQIVEDLFLHLKKKGTSIIGIFHDRSLVERLADKVLHMAEGRMVAFGKTESVAY